MTRKRIERPVLRSQIAQDVDPVIEMVLSWWFMTVLLLLAVTLFGISDSSRLAAQTISCPDSITTRQELTSSPGGWSPVVNNTPRTLAGITFYDGPPAEEASLVYDQIKHAKGEDIAIWTFARQQDRRIWLVCSYAGTAVELSRVLPPEVTTCTVSYDPGTHVAGLPAIKKISCR